MAQPGFNLQQLVNISQFYLETSARGDSARTMLAKFKEDPNSWLYADQILTTSEAPLVLKFTAIQLLQNVIKTQWGAIGPEQRAAVSNYLMNYVVNLGSDPNTDHTILQAADLALVGLLLQVWPYEYPTFIADLINSATTSESFCYNNICIIKLLCEQALENNEELLTYARANQLEQALRGEAENVYTFLEKIMSGTEKSDLILISLATLKFFVKWINPNYLLQSQFFQKLCNVFLPQEQYVSEVLDLLSEIFGSNSLPPEFAQIVPPIFTQMVQSLNQILSRYDFNEFLSGEAQRFIKILPITLTVFLVKYGMKLETPQNIDTIHTVLNWLCLLTQIEDDDILKTCCDFWLEIARRCHRERGSNLASALTEIYAPFLPKVRRCIIERMQRPDEVIIVEDESGNVTREQQRSTLTLMLHSIMKECLVLLTAIDQEDTLNAIQDLIARLSNMWSPAIYNSICWSVGAITRTLDIETERGFITKLLRIQLDMCKNQNDPNIRAIIATGIMYVCSKYPRFLQKFPVFLRTVVEKLFEFMHQNVEGVKEMAVMSFKTIATGCRRQFLMGDSGGEPFIIQIIQQYQEIVSDLTPDLIVIFFDALSSVVYSNSREATRLQQLNMLLAPLNQQWEELMVNFDPVIPQIKESIILNMKCNAAIAFNMHQTFHEQFMFLFQPMMNVYSSYSNVTKELMQINRMDEIRRIVHLKSSIIEVIKNFISRTQNPHTTCPIIIEPVVQTIFSEYEQSPPDCRTPEVLNLLSILFIKMHDPVAPYLSSILGAIFSSTVNMISQNFESYMTFRQPFYDLLKILVDKYLGFLLSVPDGFDLLIKTIQWGYKHPHIQTVCETSLDTVEILITKIRDTTPQLYNQFLSGYYLLIVHDMFEILTDTIHKFAFEKNIVLLTKLLSIQTTHLDSQRITEALLDLFPNRNPNELFEFIKQLISLSNDSTRFRIVIRDFLVTTRQFNINDPDLNRQELQQIENDNAILVNGAMNNEGLEDMVVYQG